MVFFRGLMKCGIRIKSQFRSRLDFETHTTLAHRLLGNKATSTSQAPLVPPALPSLPLFALIFGDPLSIVSILVDLAECLSLLRPMRAITLSLPALLLKE